MELSVGLVADNERYVHKTCHYPFKYCIPIPIVVLVVKGKPRYCIYCQIFCSGSFIIPVKNGINELVLESGEDAGAS